MNEDEMTPDTLRTAEEIARRTIALHCAIAAAHGVSKKDIGSWLNDEGLWDALSPREMRLLQGEVLSKKELNWMTWFAEAQFLMLWAIAKIDRLPPPTKKCDTGKIMEVMPGLFDDTKPFIRSAVLRPKEDIELEYELIYDIHCDVSQALRASTKIPGGYDKDVVFFRHYGFNWLVGYCGQTWDQIQPDT